MSFTIFSFFYIHLACLYNSSLTSFVVSCYYPPSLCPQNSLQGRSHCSTSCFKRRPAVLASSSELAIEVTCALKYFSLLSFDQIQCSAILIYLSRPWIFTLSCFSYNAFFSFSSLSLMSSLNMFFKSLSRFLIFSIIYDFFSYKDWILLSSMYLKFSRVVCQQRAFLQVSSLLSMTCSLSRSWCCILRISSSLFRFSNLMSLCCLNNFSNFSCCYSSCRLSFVYSSVNLQFLSQSSLLIPLTFTISYFLLLIYCSISLSYSFSFLESCCVNSSEFFLD